MQVRTSELSGVALDWAVAKCEGCSKSRLDNVDMWQHIRQQGAFRFATDWSQGGPIIERECITLRVCPIIKSWKAFLDTPNAGKFSFNSQSANSPLVAAMRCYVASKLGDVVDIPDELMESLK